MDDKHTFLLEEYKALRKEVEIYIAELRSMEKYTAIGVGSVWAWLLHERLTAGAPWSIPIFLTLISWWRHEAFRSHFYQLKGRFQQIERAFAIEGWEHRQERSRFTGINRGVAVLLVVASVLAWWYRDRLIEPDSRPTDIQLPAASNSR